MFFYQQTEFIDAVIKIVSQASKIVLDVYDNYDMNDIVEYKEDSSPLTIADQRASDYICDQLTKLTPEIPIICEETDDMDYEQRKDFDYIWLVDPLDGTKEFIKKNGEFTVNIGLAYQGKAVFGVVSIPCQNKIYVGSVDKDAYILESGIRRDIHVNEKKREPITIVTSRSHMNRETEEFIDRYDNPKIVSIGSSIKILLVADGTANIYPRIGPTMEWDTCAAHAVLKAAGGLIYVYDDGTIKDELSYNKENLLNPYFICNECN